MDRRRFLSILPALPFAKASRAAIRCQEQVGEGLSLCRVGLTTPDRARMARSQPVNSNWCWAACLEMIFAHHGFVVGMQRIVSEAYGRQWNFGASSRTLAALLSRGWLDDWGRAFATNCDVLWDAASGSRIEHGAAVAALRLAEGDPLLIGTRSHAMVLVGLDFSHTGTPESLQITRAVVLDPIPGQALRPLTRDELSATTVLLSPRVSPLSVAIAPTERNDGVPTTFRNSQESAFPAARSLTAGVSPHLSF